MDNEKNLNKGHRARMRAKYEVSGFSGMYDHEILEFLLFYTIPVKDTKPLAKQLLEKFGKLENVFEADIEELTSFGGVGIKTAIHINAVGRLMSELKQRKLSRKRALNKSNLKEYLIDYFINERTEKLYAIFLDKGNRIKSHKEICSGGIDSIQFDISNIVREAIIHKAVSIILAHNHPGGHREPSDFDYAVTVSIAQALGRVGINLKDHIIISDGSYYSMAENKKIF